MPLNLAREFLEELARIKSLLRGELDCAIEPAEQRLALSVNLVVHVHRRAGRLLRIKNARKPALEIFAGARRNGHDFPAGEFLEDDLPQRLELPVIQQIALADNHDVRFFNLLSVDIDYLFRKVS